MMIKTCFYTLAPMVCLVSTSLGAENDSRLNPQFIKQEIALLRAASSILSRIPSSGDEELEYQKRTDALCADQVVSTFRQLVSLAKIYQKNVEQAEGPLSFHKIESSSQLLMKLVEERMCFVSVLRDYLKGPGIPADLLKMTDTFESIMLPKP